MPVPAAASAPTAIDAITTKRALAPGTGDAVGGSPTAGITGGRGGAPDGSVTVTRRARRPAGNVPFCSPGPPPSRPKRTTGPPAAPPAGLPSELVADRAPPGGDGHVPS